MSNHQFFTSKRGLLSPSCVSSELIKSRGFCALVISFLLYYSKFAKDQLFDIAYFNPTAIDTPVRGPHYSVLKLSICHVQLALTIFNSLKSIFIFTTKTQK